MKITLELYKTRYIIEDEREDWSADELKERFSRLLVLATFPPDVVELEEGGHYEYVDDDEIVVKREKIAELEHKAKE